MATLANSLLEVQVQDAPEPAEYHFPVVLDSDGELQDVVFCVFCGNPNHAGVELCKDCGAALAGRSVERRLILGRISAYANHAGQSDRRGEATDPGAIYLGYIILVGSTVLFMFMPMLVAAFVFVIEAITHLFGK